MRRREFGAAVGATIGEDTLQISVSPDLCSGHGRCYDVSPEVFHADEEGYCAEQGTEFTVSIGQEEPARRGAAACPEAAITIIES